MTKTITSKNWKHIASKTFKNLAKIAQEELEIANGEAPAAEDGNGTAGPQEVVDAIEVIVDELEEVQEAIPAEPTVELDEEPEVEPEPEPEVEAEPVAEPVEEEKEEVAKLKSKVAELETRLAQQDLEAAADRYAKLFNGPRVQEAKFNEVIKSGKNAKHWNEKIAAIEEYQSIAGVDSSQKQAANTTNWIKPRSRTAKQSVGYITHL